MLREKEEVVDVSLAASAAAVGKQHVGILQIFGAKLVDRDRAAFLEEESPIRPVRKELEDRSRRLHAMAVFRFDQEDGLAVLQQFDRAVQHAQFVSFDVDLNKG